MTFYQKVHWDWLDDDIRLIMTKKTTTTKIGRDSGTGRFITVKQAEKRPETTQVETIKRPKK